MKKQLLVLLIIFTSITWTPHIQSHDWKEYWKKVGAAIVLSVLFRQVLNKEQSKQFGKCIKAFSPLLIPVFFERTALPPEQTQ